MADTEELRQMILNFRCSELQVLLGFAGRNKTGRKQELQVRALELLKLRSTPIQMKIKELHNIGFARGIKQEFKSRSWELKLCSTPLQMKKEFYKRRFPGLPSSPKTYNHSSGSMSNMTSAGSTLKNNPHYNSHPMSSAQQLAHSNIFPPGPLDYSAKHMPSHHSSSSNTYPVHPDVRFKRLPFYDVLGELLKPASLVPVGTSRFQENNFIFHLTPQQAHEIAISRDIRPGAKLEYSVQVQLRFCLLETSCEQDDNFPPSICVKINGKMCPLPNPIPTNKPGIEPKRPSRPVNITSLCRISPTVSNHINVSWASEFGRGYAVAVYLVRRLSSATLLQRLRAQGVRNSDHTRALIKEKLSHDADSEIATTSLRVSLMCPLGKMRMQIPCRSSTCTHLQCFDASLYLQMNEKKPTWICPVCDKAASFDTLVIDGLFLEIFNAAPECNEIQFHEDGSWSPLVSKKESQTIGSPVSHKHVTTIASPVNVPPPKPAEKVEVIDLTIDSSDEEDNNHKFDYSSRQDTKGQSSLLKNNNQGSTSSGAAPNNLHNNMGVSPNNHSLGRVHSISPVSMFQDMSLLNPASSSYCPSVPSPFPDYMQASHQLYNFSTFDFFSMMGQNENERQIPSYGSPLSMPSPSLMPCKPSAPSSPDVISLD